MIVEGGKATSLRLDAGESVKITCLEGPQVVDVWGFNEPNTDEYLSTEHTRSCLGKLTPGVGDSLFSNARRPMLTLTEDTSPGVHDLLLSACDQRRYELLGHDAPHANCADNLTMVMQGLDHRLGTVPSPFNVFENVNIGDGGALDIISPVVRAGQHVILKAEMDLLVVFSVCPMDLALTNGPDGRTRPMDISQI